MSMYQILSRPYFEWRRESANSVIRRSSFSKCRSSLCRLPPSCRPTSFWRSSFRRWKQWRYRNSTMLKHHLMWVTVYIVVNIQYKFPSILRPPSIKGYIFLAERVVTKCRNHCKCKCNSKGMCVLHIDIYRQNFLQPNIITNMRNITEINGLPNIFFFHKKACW